MPVDRPTFSESWYRVANLSPRLRSSIQVHRQHFRGQLWYVLQDPGSNDFFRLSPPAYHLVAMLDGKRTVGDVWRACNDQLGDSSPTQNEAIQLLGQLYTSNLIQAELPPDAEGLFSQYRKRKVREVQGFLTNLLFIRVPLYDPDRLLNRWVGIFGKIFTKMGFLLWLALLVVAGYFIIDRSEELFEPANKILDPDNLPLMYLAFMIIKVCHEFGHAFSVKKFGQVEGRGGEMHVMGIMFLVFTPLPYVDATSAHAFRQKWHRVIVGAGGMVVEMAIAAIAAIIWSRTGPGTVHTICYNMMFIASVSTLLFNGNPLLRFDAYYILSDLIEIPNLSQRSKQYLYYLVRRYVWGVKRAINPAHSTGERWWMVFYGIASTLYRVFIVTRILLFVAGAIPTAGVVLASAAIIAWVFVPLGKFFRYLFTNGELLRVRTRAVASVLIFVGALFVGIGLIKVPDRSRAEGVVESTEMQVVFAEAPGFLREFMPSGQAVAAGDGPLFVSENRLFDLQLTQLRADRNARRIQRGLARKEYGPAGAQVQDVYIAALDKEISVTEKKRLLLAPKAPLAGIWVAPGLEQKIGSYVQEGDTIGMIAEMSLDKMMIRTIVGQKIAAPILDTAEVEVEIRVKGRPDIRFIGKMTQILSAGQEQLPSVSLGYAAGGSTQTAQDDPKGRKTAEKFFEIRIGEIVPDFDPKYKGADAELRSQLWSGQRVIVRFDLPHKSIAVQFWRGVRQLFLVRFGIA